jgi:hypothetical protein
MEWELMEDRSKNNKIETKDKSEGDQKRKLAKKYFMATLFWNRRSPFQAPLLVMFHCNNNFNPVLRAGRPGLSAHVNIVTL